MDLNERLKDLRTTKKITMEELGKNIDASKMAISRWESGERKPRQQYIKEYAKYFNVSEDWIRYGDYKEYIESVIKKALAKNPTNELYKEFQKTLERKNLSYLPTSPQENYDSIEDFYSEFDDIENVFLSDTDYKQLVEYIEKQEVDYNESSILKKAINYLTDTVAGVESLNKALLLANELKILLKNIDFTIDNNTNCKAEDGKLDYGALFSKVEFLVQSKEKAKDYINKLKNDDLNNLDSLIDTLMNLKTIYKK